MSSLSASRMVLLLRLKQQQQRQTTTSTAMMLYQQSCRRRLLQNGRNIQRRDYTTKSTIRSSTSKPQSSLTRSNLSSLQSTTTAAASFSTLASSASLDPFVAAFFREGSWFSLRPEPSIACPVEQQQTKETNNNNTLLLATSSGVVVVAEEETTAQRLVRHVTNWIQRWWNNCYHAALLTARGSEVVLRLSPLLVLTPASILSDKILCSLKRRRSETANISSSSPNHNNNVVADVTWAYFMSSMQALGPAFVKLCQWVATRRDIFPPHVCDRLSKLHDRGFPHSYHYTLSVLQEAFGDDDYCAKNGLYVSPTVLGCGSAAQVHAGTLTVPKKKQKNNSNTTTTTTTEEDELEIIPVAVKILHPRFAQLVQRDLQFLQAAANCLHSLPIETIKMMNIPRACHNFGLVLERQADLTIEAENLKQFRKNFYGSNENNEQEDSSSIVFPKPIDGWISRNVLVEELVTNAVPVSEYLKLEDTVQANEIRKQLAGPLLRAFLKMVFLDNFVHCDLHPGNVLIQTTPIIVDTKNKLNNDSWWNSFSHLLGQRPQTTNADPSDPAVKRTIVFLDAGIATSLSPIDQRNLHDLFKAVILNDGEHAGRLMVERAKFERCTAQPGGLEAFSNGIQALVSEFHDNRKQKLTLGAVRIGSLLSRVLELCRVHGVEIDPAMASIVISTLVLEGLGRSLEPDLNLMDFAVPFILGRGRI